MEQNRQPDESINKNRRRLFALGTAVAVILGGTAVYSQFQLAERDRVQSSEHAVNYEHPLHKDITATVFWAGEGANSSNDFIHNRSSAWAVDWVSAYGGVDDPDNRCEYRPCAFTPKENPFYFALPFSDYTKTGLKPAEELTVIPWYDEATAKGETLLKNRWIQINHEDTVAYAQWEDVGPFEAHDAEYVFGDAAPISDRAGIDMSPALADYLGIEGRAKVSWRFIDATDVPAGEWTKIITRSAPQF